MGLIQAAIGAAGGVLADQWKEFFYCEALPKEVLVTKGQKRITGRSSNTKATDNIISSGSGIAVADGQCMIIVDQGKIVEVCAMPGEFTYDASSEPSIFTGNLKESIIETFKAVGKRFTYGGDPGKDQRIYYINTKEIIDNKFGTPNPIPFRVVDRNINLDIDVSVRCSGVYSYRIEDPLLFYTNVCGNVTSEYTRNEIDSQLKTEFISALQPAFAKISTLQVRPNEVPAHAEELADAMNEALTRKWLNLRGISIVSVALNSITLPDEDRDMIKEAQRVSMLRNPTMAAATLVGAQSDAMKAAASNQGGAMMGFMGMGMAQQAGGMNAQNLYAMGQQQQQSQTQQTNPPQASIGATNLWSCGCGTQNSGNFCTNCAKPKPTSPSQWTCSCGTVNTGKFCYNCGKPTPSGTIRYRCNKCGWEPENSAQPPKFCPECGDTFDENDKQ
ncbi:MAG: SPFH domain-containing protein [Clostridiaceae bacterium]|nr:SPFH domain-containing protein [Clostridiaceae bacterium]